MKPSVLQSSGDSEEERVAPAIVLAFAAPMGGGKTAVSTALAERLNATQVSFDGYLRRLTQEQGVPITREVLRQLGDEMVRKDVRTFCAEVLRQQPWDPGQPLVIDGVRHLEVLETLRELLAPALTYLVYIKVDRLTQAKRLVQDGLPHNTSLEELERNPTEIQVRSVLPDRAALILDGVRPVGELAGKVIEFMTWSGGKEPQNWEQKNTRRIELARKKNREGLTALELAEFDQLQTSYFDYLDAKHPRTPLDANRLDEIEQRLASTKKSAAGD